MEFDKNFEVQGRNSKYNVRVIANAFGMKAHCSCPAGKYNALCRHVIEVIENNEDVRAAMEE